MINWFRKDVDIAKTGNHTRITAKTKMPRYMKAPLPSLNFQLSPRATELKVEQSLKTHLRSRKKVEFNLTRKGVSERLVVAAEEARNMEISEPIRDDKRNVITGDSDGNIKNTHSKLY